MVAGMSDLIWSFGYVERKLSNESEVVLPRWRDLSAVCLRSTTRESGVTANGVAVGGVTALTQPRIAYPGT